MVEYARTGEHKQGDFVIVALRHSAPASQPFQRSLALFVSWDSLGLSFQFDPVDICLPLCYWTCWVQPKVWILKKKITAQKEGRGDNRQSSHRFVPEHWIEAPQLAHAEEP